MLKKVNQCLNVLLGAMIGVYAGYSLYSFLEFKARPGLYAMYSAPWYTGLLLYGVCLLAAVAVIVIIKLILHKKYSDKS